jgi:hypothetical protein
MLGYDFRPPLLLLALLEEIDDSLKCAFGHRADI